MATCQLPQHTTIKTSAVGMEQSSFNSRRQFPEKTQDTINVPDKRIYALYIRYISHKFSQ